MGTSGTPALFPVDAHHWSSDAAVERALRRMHYAWHSWLEWCTHAARSRHALAVGTRGHVTSKPSACGWVQLLLSVGKGAEAPPRAPVLLPVRTDLCFPDWSNHTRHRRSYPARPIASCRIVTTDWLLAWAGTHHTHACVARALLLLHAQKGTTTFIFRLQLTSHGFATDLHSLQLVDGEVNSNFRILPLLAVQCGVGNAAPIAFTVQWEVYSVNGDTDLLKRPPDIEL